MRQIYKMLLFVIFLIITVPILKGATDSIYVVEDVDDSTTYAGQGYTVYRSVQTALTTEDKDLTTSGDTIIFLISDGWDNPEDYWSIYSTDWVTADTALVIIKTIGDARHPGTWCDTCYRVSSASYQQVINIWPDCGLDHIIIDGIQVYNSRTGDRAWGVYWHELSVKPIFDNCIFKGNPAETGAQQIAGIYLEGGDSLQVQNSLFYNFYSSTTPWGSGVVTGVSADVLSYNNTFDSCQYGIARFGVAPYFVVNNCLFTNMIDGACYADATTRFDNSCDYNMTDAENFDSMTTNTNDSVSATIVYADRDNDDYHLASGDDAIDLGMDLSSPTYGTGFSTDIDGDTRSTWDIGADEYVSAVEDTNDLTVLVSRTGTTATSFNVYVSATAVDSALKRIALYSSTYSKDFVPADSVKVDSTTSITNDTATLQSRHWQEADKVYFRVIAEDSTEADTSAVDSVQLYSFSYDLDNFDSTAQTVLFGCTPYNYDDSIRYVDVQKSYYDVFVTEDSIYTDSVEYAYEADTLIVDGICPKGCLPENVLIYYRLIVYTDYTTDTTQADSIHTLEYQHNVAIVDTGRGNILVEYSVGNRYADPDSIEIIYDTASGFGTAQTQWIKSGLTVPDTFNITGLSPLTTYYLKCAQYGVADTSGLYSVQTLKTRKIFLMRKRRP